MEKPAYEGTVGGLTSIRSVATLADEPTGLTCSVDVAKRWASTQPGDTTICGYPSFEEAAQSVRAGVNDVLLVPSAYTEIKRFFFDDALRAVDVFLASLPDFVLAINDQGTLDEAEVLYYHPSTVALVDRANISGSRRQTATSNSSAARLAKEADTPAAAVTNALCADGYHLTTVRVLSQGTPMTFNLFRVP